MNDETDSIAVTCSTCRATHYGPYAQCTPCSRREGARAFRDAIILAIAGAVTVGGVLFGLWEACEGRV